MTKNFNTQFLKGRWTMTIWEMGVAGATSLNRGRARSPMGLVKTSLRDGKFARDLGKLVARLSEGLPPEVRTELDLLMDKLIWLHEEGRVKINHSAMELVCARELLLMGYSVDVEHEIGGLTCDVYAEVDGHSLVVEIETGFVPPEHALDPLTYCRARVASKIARYGCLADRFALGLPPHYLAIIPSAFLKEGRERGEEEVKRIKALCDYYYHNPPVSEDEILRARLDWILVVDVDALSAKMMSPRAYAELSRHVLARLGIKTI